MHPTSTETATRRELESALTPAKRPCCSAVDVSVGGDGCPGLLRSAYPFSHPVRVFINPHDSTDIRTTSFGGDLFEARRPLFADGFESGNLGAWSYGP